MCVCVCVWVYVYTVSTNMCLCVRLVCALHHSCVTVLAYATDRKADRQTHKQPGGQDFGTHMLKLCLGKRGTAKCGLKPPRDNGTMRLMKEIDLYVA